MKSSWVTHVKAFAQKHKMKYGDALKMHNVKANIINLKVKKNILNILNSIIVTIIITA
jgi:hypothetical protein